MPKKETNPSRIDSVANWSFIGGGGKMSSEASDARKAAAAVAVAAVRQACGNTFDYASLIRKKHLSLPRRRCSVSLSLSLVFFAWQL